MQADNRGEGGILALLALVRPRTRATGARAVLISLGLFGAALLYGDGIITPAISVLGAIEGLGVATPALQPFVVPIAVVILTVLFLFQRQGTVGVGAVFGPVMTVWFLCIAALGVRASRCTRRCCAALNPGARHRLLRRATGVPGFLVLAAVVLVVTGGEALYADMGHFGKRPIRLDLVRASCCPACCSTTSARARCCSSRSGGGAESVLLARARVGPVSDGRGVATAAAIVASQALISGAFSLTRQAVQLGYCPRVTIVHTSKTEMGQIYIPEVNQALWLGVPGAGGRVPSSDQPGGRLRRRGHRHDDHHDACCSHVVARDRWGWPAAGAWALTALFLVVDLALLRRQPRQDPAGRLVPAGGRRSASIR